MILQSNAFINGLTVNPAFTCNGQGLTPSFQWSGSPPGTKSYALVIIDPDAHVGKDGDSSMKGTYTNTETFIHWFVFNIPANVSSLDQNSRYDMALNSKGTTSYVPLCPPEKERHRYIATIYALDDTLKIPSGSSSYDVSYQMGSKILDHASIISFYR